MQAPTWVEGSLERWADNVQIPIKYSSQEIASCRLSFSLIENPPFSSKNMYSLSSNDSKRQGEWKERE